MSTNAPSHLPSVAKWGDVANAGFQIVPDALLKYQTDIGLSATDILVLINLTMHWWYADKKPFPRVSTIAKRMNVSVRTVQRTMNKLQNLKLIEKKNISDEYGKEMEVVDLAGLIAALEPYARRDRGYRPRGGVSSTTEAKEHEANV